MHIRVLAFAVLRDRLGFAERTVELPAGTTAEGAAALLLGSPAPRGIAYAVNQSYASPDTVLAEGDELALLPPVSGGAPEADRGVPPPLPLLRIQREPIDPEEAMAAVRSPECGAVLLFLGCAREVPGERLVALEYEAYPAMAERWLVDLAAEIRTRHGVERLAVLHRTGSVAAGEVSIAIAVASPHRGPAFDALRHAIEAIKEGLPVWKKEVTERGGRWVAVEKMEGA